MADFETRILPHFQEGRLRPIIDQVFSLNEIQYAHKRMEDNLNIGKILLKVNHEEDVAADSRTIKQEL